MPTPADPNPSTEEQLRTACAELERRLRAGEECHAEDYLRTLPELAEHVDQAADLIYTEYLIRLELGQQDLAARFYDRFPKWKEYLQQQFAVHDWLRQDTPPLESPSALKPDSSATWNPDAPARADTAPAAVPTAADWPEHYEFLGELARGGMGVVYKARQKGLGRVVALKMLKAEEATAAELERFRAEAEIIARLQHPHIVQIYEIGACQGRPFLALEYVSGGSLAQALAAGPLPPPDAARLLEVTARAVHLVHEHGILHRDIKPANILLTLSRAPKARVSDEEEARAFDEKEARAFGARLNDAVPKITDFGLAKRLDATGPHTKTGAIVGTPGYMAPEQVTNQREAIGPATDVYALGVVLYECLTGRPPFQAAHMIDLFEAIALREPVPPTRLQPKLPLDLETICLKCLQKEPGQRYASAADLADDLGRFQRGEPIHARPISSAQRAWRWCRRNPVVAGLLALFLVTLVTGTVVSTVFWWQADQRLVDLQYEYNRAEENLRLANERQQRAVHHYREMLNTVYDFHLTVSQSPDLERPGLIGLRDELLTKVLVFLDGVVKEPGQDPALQIRRAQAQKARGELFVKLGKEKDAEAAFTEAIALLRPLVASRPDDLGLRHWLAGCLTLLGDQLAIHGRAREGLPHLQAALEELTALRRKSPDSVPLLINHAQALFNLAQAQHRLQQFGPAETTLREGIGLLEPLCAPETAESEPVEVLARGVNSMGSLLVERGKFGAAQPWLERARDLYERARKQRPDSTRHNRELAKVHNQLGRNLRQLRKPTESLAAFQTAEEMLRKLLKENPGVPDYRRGLSYACQQMGDVLAAQNQRPAGLKKLEESVALLEKVQPLTRGEHIQLRDSYESLANVLREANRPADALAPSRRAVELTETLLQQLPGSPEIMHHLGGHWSNLGLTHVQLKEWDEARAACLKAIGFQRQALAAYPNTHQVRFFLSLHLLTLSEAERGRQQIDAAMEAVREFQKLWPADSTKHVDAARQYAKCYAAVGQSTTGPEDDAWRERCAQEVITTLREALRLGFRDVREIRNDKVYDPLRQRPDFQEVYRELEAKAQGATSPPKTPASSGSKP